MYDNNIPCYSWFENGVCDADCNTPECLYDGHDCDVNPIGTCHPSDDVYCLSHYGDGFCDSGCDSIQCSWDGLDCLSKDKIGKFASGSIVIVIIATPENFTRQSNLFLRKLSELLHGVVVVQKDRDGKDMVYPYPNNRTVNRRKRAASSQVTGYTFLNKLHL